MDSAEEKRTIWLDYLKETRARRWCIATEPMGVSNLGEEMKGDGGV
jgi:hypothetical protein